MKTYIVTADLKFPSCYHRGYEFEIHAPNKAAAIKSARRLAFNEGHHSRIDGPLSYSAQVAE